MVGIPGFSAQLHFLTTNRCSLKCAKNCAKSYVWKVLQRFRFEHHLADSVSSSSLSTIMGVASVSDSLGRVFSLGGAAITINPTHQHSKAEAATLQNCCFAHRLEHGVADCRSQFFCSFLTQKPWEFHRKVHFPPAVNAVCPWSRQLKECIMCNHVRGKRANFTFYLQRLTQKTGGNSSEVHFARVTGSAPPLVELRKSKWCWCARKERSWNLIHYCSGKWSYSPNSSGDCNSAILQSKAQYWQQNT